MEVLAEQIVATYLTRGGKVFIVPQYSIPSENGQGDWACPDLLALDFEKKEVIVIEVATGSRFKNLIDRIAERETRWFKPIQAKLAEDGLKEQSEWPIRFLGFVRKESLPLALRPFVDQKDVSFMAIEEATFPWTYWNERMERGLP